MRLLAPPAPALAKPRLNFETEALQIGNQLSIGVQVGIAQALERHAAGAE